MQLPKQQGLKFLSDLARIWPAAWRTFWHTNKKVRVNKTLTWGFNGAGDGNRTRVPSLEGWCPGRCATPAGTLTNSALES